MNERSLEDSGLCGCNAWALRRPKRTSGMDADENEISCPAGASEMMKSGSTADHGASIPPTILESRPMVGAILLFSMRESVGCGTPVRSLASLSEMPRASRRSRSLMPNFPVRSRRSEPRVHPARLFEAEFLVISAEPPASTAYGIWWQQGKGKLLAGPAFLWPRAILGQRTGTSGAQHERDESG